MSKYIRTTKECSVNQLHPELLRAIQNHFQEHALGHLQAETIACCETISKRKSASEKISWLSGKPDTIIHTGMLLTSQWLIWVHYGDRSGIRLNAANLSEIRTEFLKSLFTKDASLEIVGYISNAKARVRGTIALGPDLAAEKFCEAVKEAIHKANPPKPNKPFKWLSGG